MAEHDRNLSEAERKEVFLALVDAQDQEGATMDSQRVADSRRIIAEKFGITENQVRRIEQEGLANEWPPL